MNYVNYVLGLKYRRHSELIFRYNFCLKALMQEGLPEPAFNGDNLRIKKKCWLNWFFGTTHTL